MNVQQNLIEGQARNQALLEALTAQLAERDARWLRDLEAVNLKAQSAEDKADRAQKILDGFQVRGSMVLVSAGLFCTMIGAIVALKTSGWLAQMLAWAGSHGGN